MIIDDGLRILHDDGAWMMQICANIEGTFPADDPFHGGRAPIWTIKGNLEVQLLTKLEET